ncbi:hypothetical protein JG688_00012108 [Phytophthora aleatoria]|uniref:Uncharacterized protein n=1 Tax=Phytophthora aleatoria TaxID=2496075 RepID=A0A8J5M080_9STRA|nr:hypothetical protein JG688_00012108 [Phytophthora aleatoria]
METTATNLQRSAASIDVSSSHGKRIRFLDVKWGEVLGARITIAVDAIGAISFESTLRRANSTRLAHSGETGTRQSMSSVRRLLLIAALALAIAADARTDATLSTLTLSPGADSLITTRGDPTKTDTSSTTTAIGSAELDTNKVTEAPATQAPATTAPSTKATDPPATTAPPTNSESDSASASNSDEQDAADSPAKVSPGSTSTRSSLDSTTQTDAAPSTSTSSKSSTASVDTLNDSNGELSTGNASSIATIVPSVFGALACVGAIIVAVTYKKKRGLNGDDNDGNRPDSDWEYTGGADFTPENRALNTVQEDNPPKTTVEFAGTNSSVSSTSPFGSTRCMVRVSSPVSSYYTSSQPNMEFQDTYPRHEGGSNVVLTFDEVPTDSRRGAPQVQL